MNYVMEMSTDADIRATQLNVAWDSNTKRYDWEQVRGMGLEIPNAATIIVIAHGDGNEIGNKIPGVADINPETFLVLIQRNMQINSFPSSIYISTCGPGIALFTAAVRIAAQSNKIWANTRIFGHSNAVQGNVPPPNDISWTQIF